MKMNRILFVLSFLLLTHLNTWAQFADVADPYSGEISAYENRGNSLLVADKGDSSSFYENQIMLRWVNENGTISFANKYRNTTVFDTSFSIVAVTQSSNSVYVVARGPISGIERDRVLKYDTTTKVWSTVNGLNSFMDAVLVNSQAKLLKAFDGNLIVAGAMYDVGNANRILTYFPNGDSVNNLAVVDTVVLGMDIHNGELYAWGLFSVVGSTPTGGLIHFPNSITWQDPNPNDNSRRYKHVSWISSSEKIVQDDANNIFHEQAIGSVNLPSIYNNQFQNTLYSALRFANRLFITINIGGGNRTFVYEDALKDWVSVDTTDSFVPHYLAQVNTTMLHITLNSSFYRIKRFTRLGVILKTNVYMDLNTNCQRDANEPGLAGNYISEANGIFGILTDPDGRSFQYVDPGNYFMDTISGLDNYLRSPCTKDSISIPTNADTVYFNVPYQIIDPNKTIVASIHAITGFRARQGFNETYIIDIKNVGATTKTCDFYIRIPSEFHRTYLSEPIVDSASKQYKINLTLNPQQSWSINLRCLVPVNLQALKWHEVEFFSDTNCKLEIKERVRVQIRGAYDPNDKQSSEDALMPKETKKLRYHIRFQNTGTDTAYRVRIIDTIDRNLALNLIKIKTASHAHRVEVLHEPGSPYYALHFIFDNIHLPDSNTDEPGSHGYIQYEATLRNGFSDKDTVFNTAHIFFDYQSAIITNTVENSFDTAGKNFIPPTKDYSHYISLYPNPTNRDLHIKNSLGRPLNLVIMDSRGSTIGYSHCGPLGETVFNCETLAPGIYYMMSTDKLIRKRFIVVKE